MNNNLNLKIDTNVAKSYHYKITPPGLKRNLAPFMKYKKHRQSLTKTSNILLIINKKENIRK